MRFVTLRELNQHVSRYLKAVEDGEALVVTKRGKRIARIVPETDAVEARRNDPAYQALCEVLDRPLPLGGRDWTREDLHERHG